MSGKRSIKKMNKTPDLKAQAIVEFAFALPILLALVIGILEVGRLIFIYSSVTNASRNAARYASAFGLNDAGYHKYMYCDGIKDIAIKSTYLVPSASLDIDVEYDEGPGTGLKVADLDGDGNTCDFSGGDDMDVFNGHVSTGDRVTVTVSTQYQPLTKLIPISPRTITSSSSKTILGIVDLSP